MKNSIWKNIFFIASTLCFHIVFAQKTYTLGLNFDDIAYKHTPVNKAELKRNYEILPSKADLKPYCPTPQLQGDRSTCVGWAVGYTACTIIEGIAKNITDKTQLDELATSPDFIFAFGKKPTDSRCTNGIEIDKTLAKLYGLTIPRKKNFKMICTTTALPIYDGEGIKVKQHTRLFKDDDSWQFKLAQIKRTLSNKKPVVIGIECSKSFFDIKDVWDGNTSNFQGGHALCIVGYNDAFQGGAVEVMNSWGKEWGKEGFGWIKYGDLQGILKYAYEITTDFQTTDAHTTERQPNKQTIVKSPELSVKISLKLNNGTEMPVVLNNLDSRGLKPVKENGTASNNTPSVSNTSTTVSNAFGQYKTVQSYASGTRYRIYLDISQPLYLYVLGSDLTGQVAALFPPDETISPFLSNKNTAIALPDEQWFIEMDDTKGKDFMLFLYSSTPLSISSLISTLNNEKGAFLEKTVKNLDTKLQFVDSKNLEQNIIRFQVPFHTDIIQAVSLEIDHQ